MRWDIVLPLILAALVLFVVVMFVRRGAKALARTRELDRYGQETQALTSGMDAELGRIIGRVDAVRRGQIGPGEIESDLAAARAFFDAAHAEASAITPPQVAGPDTPVLHRDVERAQRALEMVDHGCRLAAGVGGRRSELEAQTSIKRGYLNLLHAREALSEHAADVVSLREDVMRKWRASRI